MKLSVVGLGALLVMLSLHTTLAAVPGDCDPVYEEFTLSFDCDPNCQNICNPVTDHCICRQGYSRDLSTGSCIPEDQCDPVPEEITFGCLGA